MKMQINQRHNDKGLTLVELLVALMVTSIVLTAVATLAYALGTVNEASDDTSRKQAEVRYATLRISELVRHCKLICATPGNDIVIWKADDSPSNDRIDVLELAYIENAGEENCMNLMEFSFCPSWLESWFVSQSSQIDVLGQSGTKDLFVEQCTETRSYLIRECSNVQFLFDELPPWSKLVTISFEVQENEVLHSYQISAALRGRAGNLLDSSGEIVSSGDDD